MTAAVQAAVLVGKLPETAEWAPFQEHFRTLRFRPRERRSETAGSGPSTLLRLPQIGADIDIRRVSQQGRRIHYCHSSTVHATASVCRTRCRSVRCPHVLGMRTCFALR